MPIAAPRAPARAHGELTTMPARVRRRYTYFVWPYGSPTAHAACEPLSTAMYEAARARMHGTAAVWIVHIPPNLVVEGVTAHRKPPEVRIWRLRNQSRVGTFPPSTSTPQWPACLARR